MSSSGSDIIPTFFFSHARQDRDTPEQYLDQFFRDLELRVAAYCGKDLKKVRIGTIDKRVLLGTDWDRELSGPLSTNKVLVAVYSPLFFERENCGKELFIFLNRSGDLDIDSGGKLKNVRNVLPIRWFEEKAYDTSTEEGGVIPSFLRNLSTAFGDEGKVPQKKDAIDLYLRQGMEGCVDIQPSYRLLLSMLALQIRDMDPLPSTSGKTFADAKDAFKVDWKRQLNAAEVTHVGYESNPRDPQALTSLVVFCLTRRPLTSTETSVAYADHLIVESSQVIGDDDPAFSAVLADIRRAGTAEKISVLQACAFPAIPENPAQLISQLKMLSKLSVLTAIVVDPAIWPEAANDSATDVVDKIVASTEWSGSVFLPKLDVTAAEINVKALDVNRVAHPVVPLPTDSAARISVLRQAIVDARGRIWQADAQSGNDNPVGGERLPLLKGVGGERS